MEKYEGEFTYAIIVEFSRVDIIALGFKTTFAESGNIIASATEMLSTPLAYKI